VGWVVCELGVLDCGLLSGGRVERGSDSSTLGTSCGILRLVELSVGPLAGDEWPAARALLHRAFVTEPFTLEMYGEPLLDRWGGSWDLYSSLRSGDSSIVLGARVGEVLVGVVMGSTPGHCRLCRVLAREPRPEDHHLAIDWEFHQNAAEVHARLGEHAWVEKAAVEPALHGCGIGRRLLESAAGALQVGERGELVLECAPDRAGFYTGLGYDVIGTFSDPAGPDAYLMGRSIR
jgi:GNAT superfamily N-acetyltransferase